MDNRIREKEIKSIAERWNALVNLVIGNSVIDDLIFQDLAKDTFKVLSSYDEQVELPRAIAELLVLITEFTVWVLISDNRGLYDEITSQLVWQCIKTFKNSDSQYPKMKLSCGLNAEYFSFDTDNISDLKIREDYLPF